MAAALWLLLTGLSVAQPAEFPEAFQTLLQQLGVDVYRSADGDYKPLPLESMVFQPCDFAWYSRAEKLEIRYLARPWNENDFSSQFPHILAARMAAHVASNEEGAFTTVFSLGTEELRAFNADWGAAYFFQPKAVFSERRHGELVVLHKAGRGTMMVFFLFDDPGNEALDLRFQALSFME
jgi:hypothetical protein